MSVDTTARAECDLLWAALKEQDEVSKALAAALKRMNRRVEDLEIVVYSLTQQANLTTTFIVQKEVDAIHKRAQGTLIEREKRGG